MSACGRTRAGATRSRGTPPSTPPRHRRPPSSWAAQTDPDFRFLVKLPKIVTHERRLAGGDAELRTFLDAIAPLGPRAETLWIQLPGSFGPDDVPALAAFLRRLPDTHRYAVEVRHRDFFDDPRAAARLEATLNAVAAEWVPFDTTAFFADRPTSDAERDAWMKKPRMPLRAAALTDRPIVRYLGRDDTDTAPSRAGSAGSASSPAGCARGARRRSSSTPPTTPTRRPWPADSTTRSARACPSWSRCPSRRRSNR